MKKIASDLTPILPGGENGGAKIFVLNLVQLLAKKAPDTNFVVLTQAKSHEELYFLDASNVKRLIAYGNYDVIASQKYLKKLTNIYALLPKKIQALISRVIYKYKKYKKKSGLSLNGLGVDLLFCPFTSPTFYEPGIKTVSVVYDLQFNQYPQFFSPEDLQNREISFMDAVKKSDHLVAISNFSKNSAIGYGSVKPDQITTIYLTVNNIQIENEYLKILTELALEKKQYLIYPANFWLHKNHEMLLTAFSIAIKNGLNEEIKLVCTGQPGHRQKALIKAALQMGISDRVIFPGYVNNSDLAVLLSNSSGLIFPSLYEGFGLPLIEAMASRIPIACSNTSSLPEVVENAAILFNPRRPLEISNAIIELTLNLTLRDKLIELGDERVNLFNDPQVMCDEYWTLFQRISKKTNDFVFGLHSDQWAGPYLFYVFKPSTGTRFLEIEFIAPNFLPFSKNIINIEHNEVLSGTKVIVARGNKHKISLPIDYSGCTYKIIFEKIFIPSQLGLGDDHRELSLKISSKEISAQ